MRQRGILHRIIALLALVALVLPASARVASCMTQVRNMTCCMNQPEPKATVEPENECCKPKSIAKKSGPEVSEVKSGCHCLKSIPTALPNESITQMLVVGDEVTIVPETIQLLNLEPDTGPIQVIFSSDSSPPREPFSALHSGRAPPVSVN